MGIHCIPVYYDYHSFFLGHMWNFYYSFIICIPVKHVQASALVVLRIRLGSLIPD